MAKVAPRQGLATDEEWFAAKCVLLADDEDLDAEQARGKRMFGHLN